MKKNLFTAGLIVIASMTLTTNCVKSEIESEVTNPEVVDGIPFKLILNTIDTKTVNNGLSTIWAAGDEINVFHAVSGESSYVNDGKFTISDVANGVFSGNLASALDDGVSYDWYVFYPYSSYITTPANTSAGYSTVAPISAQTQTGNDSKAHLTSLPLSGKSTTAPGVSSPSIAMYQMSSVIKVVVTNNTGVAIPVSSVKITATPDAGHSDIYISGNYYVNFTNPVAPVYTPAASKSNAVTLNTSYSIAASSTAAFYVAVKPFSVETGDVLKVKVNNYEKSLAVTANKSFAPGDINLFSFNYNEASYATLPFSIDGTGGKSAYASTTGVSSSGVTADYADSHSPYLAKFDDTGDYVEVCFDSAADKASIGVKMIGGSNSSSFDVKGSADGLSFTQIEKLTVSGSTGSILDLQTSAYIDESYRFIRFVFNKGSNVGVGPISITKASTDPKIISTNITDIPAIGGSKTTSYTIKNFVGADDVSVKSVDGTVVTSASVTSAGTVSYTVAPNYGTGSVNGSITLTSDNESIDKEIIVTQLGETFATTAIATITLPNNSTSNSFTITTPTFAWASTVTPEAGMDLTITPSSGSANVSAQTITVNSSTASTSSEQALGTIVLYRNGNTSDTQKITITVKKASNAAITYTKVTSISDGTYLICNASDGYVISDVGDYFTTTSVSISGGTTITGNDTISDYEFTITALTGADTGKYSIKFDYDDKYVGWSSGTKVSTNASVANDKYKWTIVIDGSGLATIQTYEGSASKYRYWGWYGSGSQYRLYQTTGSYGNTPLPTLFKKD